MNDDPISKPLQFRFRGGKMNNAAAKPVAKRSAGALFAVFLIGIATSAAQTPADQARQIELQKERERECLRQSAARSAPIFIGVPTLSPHYRRFVWWP